MRIAAVSLALAGVLIAVPAAAVDRLVDDNLVPCMSGPLPLHATISGAVEAASAGETIVVCAGTYTEHVAVNRDNLTLRAQGFVRLVSSGTAGSGLTLDAGGVTIQGFDISGYAHCGIEARTENVVGDLYIRDNHIHDNDVGIAPRRCSIRARKSRTT